LKSKPPKTTTIPDLPPTDGPRVCRWIHLHAVLGEGDYFGLPFRLRDWQRRFIYRLYERNPDGTRKYRRGLLGLPKGNGKTPLAAAIAAYELLGGRHVSPVVIVCAASLKQADLVFGDLRTMCRESPSLAAVTEPYDLEILIKDGPGRAQRVAAEAGVNDGARPTAVVFDELHEFAGRKERVHLVLANGTSKRSESLQLNISTAGWDSQSLLGKLYAHGRKVEAGEIDDPSFLFEWWQADKDCDLSTEEARRDAIQACNPAAGDFLSLDDVARRYHEMPEFEWRRYHLNQWTAAPTRWLPLGTWAGRAAPDRRVAPEQEVVLAFDGSYSGDATCLIGCTRDEHIFVVESWEKPPVASDDWRVDIAEVEERIRRACREYNVRQVVCDPHLWSRSLQALTDEGLPMVEFPSRTVARMVTATKTFYDAVTGGRLTHDGDYRLADHIGNAVIKEDSAGTRITKAHSTSGRRIDLAVAAIMAHAVVISTPPPKRSVYETRGFLSV
jgi:phage terminase large subunit-like protein